MTKSKRDSNIELLRLLAMLMVVGVHANFWTLGTPTAADIQAAPVPSFTRYLLEALTVVCVNLFVLISGYFRIRPSVRGLANLLFLCAFYALLPCIIHVAVTHTVSFEYLKAALLKSSDYWFIKSYLALYLLAPLLNCYLDHACRHQQFLFLVAFYVFQTYFGFLGDSTGFIAGGYSVWSFIGLYCLSAYARAYSGWWSRCRSRVLWACYLGSSLLIALSAFGIRTLLGDRAPNLELVLYDYIFPLVVFSSLCFFLLFTRMKFQSAVINKLAASAFAVYFLHIHVQFRDYFQDCVDAIYRYTSGPVCLLYFLVLVLTVYLIGVCIDQLRILLWRVLSVRILPFLEKKLNDRYPFKQ